MKIEKLFIYSLISAGISWILCLVIGILGLFFIESYSFYIIASGLHFLCRTVLLISLVLIISLGSIYLIKKKK